MFVPRSVPLWESAVDIDGQVEGCGTQRLSGGLAQKLSDSEGRAEDRLQAGKVALRDGAQDLP